MVERRRLERRHILFYSRVFDRKTGVFLGYLGNMNAGGMMIISEDPLETDCKYLLRIDLPDENYILPVLNFEAKSVLRESHPEICFWGLNGCSEMKYNKKDTLGKCERIQLLELYIKDVEKIFYKTRSRYKKNQVADDDVIDALVCAVTALFNSSLSTFPPTPEEDAKGISMEIVYINANMKVKRSILGQGLGA